MKSLDANPPASTERLVSPAKRIERAVASRSASVIFCCSRSLRPASARDRPLARCAACVGRHPISRSGESGSCGGRVSRCSPTSCCVPRTRLRNQATILREPFECQAAVAPRVQDASRLVLRPLTSMCNGGVHDRPSPLRAAGSISVRLRRKRTSTVDRAADRDSGRSRSARQFARRGHPRSLSRFESTMDTTTPGDEPA